MMERVERVVRAATPPDLFFGSQVLVSVSLLLCCLSAWLKEKEKNNKEITELEGS